MIAVEFVLASGAADVPPYNTTAAMLQLRQQLLEPRRSLVYSSNGCGDILVNVQKPNSVRDVAWGPVPTVMTWQPTGTASAKVAFKVETWIPTCSDAAFQKQVMELVWRTEIGIDRSGLTTRHFTGHLTIPLTVPSNIVATNFPDTTADAWREKIIPKPLLGYRRIPGGFTLSEDQRTLSWNITDEQMPSPNPNPPDCIEVSASQSMSISAAEGAAGPEGRWSGSLQATYEMILGTSRSAPFFRFQELLQDRIKNALKAAVANPQKKAFIVTALTMAEPEIYGKKCASFSANWFIVCAKEDILGRSGLWRPTPHWKWDLWQTTMSKAVGPRGISGMEIDPESCLIVDLCDPVAALAVKTEQKAPPNNPGKGGGKPSFSAPEFNDEPIFFQNDTPPPEASYVQYRLTLGIEQTDETVLMKSLPSSEIDLTTTPATQQLSATASAPLIVSQTAAPPNIGAGQRRPSVSLASVEAYRPHANKVTSEVETRTLPTIAIWLTGYAVRCGYPIAPPSVLEVAGVKVVPANRGQITFAQTTIANFGGVPCNMAMWRLRYLLPQFPENKDFALPANPYLGT